MGEFAGAPTITVPLDLKSWDFIESNVMYCKILVQRILNRARQGLANLASTHRLQSSLVLIKLHIYVSIRYLSICLSVCLIYPRIYLSIYLSTPLPTCCLPACCLPTYLPTCLPACLPIYLCTYRATSLLGILQSQPNHLETQEKLPRLLAIFWSSLVRVQTWATTSPASFASFA